jgi:hypothetical protein
MTSNTLMLRSSSFSARTPACQRSMARGET